MPSAARVLALSGLGLCLLASSLPASAHGGRGGVRWRPAIVVGAPFYAPYYYGSYYAYPPVYAAPYYSPYYYGAAAQPPVYVEQAPAAVVTPPAPAYTPAPVAPAPVPAAPAAPLAAPAQPTAAYWYWCQNPRGYYPSVADCPGGWQPVLPQVPPAPPGAPVPGAAPSGNTGDVAPAG